MPTAIADRIAITGRTVIGKPRLRLADCQLITTNTGGNDECLVVGSASAATQVHDIEITNCNTKASANNDGVAVIQNSYNIRFINCFFSYLSTFNGAYCTNFSYDSGGDGTYPVNRDNWITCQECEWDSFARAPEVYGGVVNFIDCVFNPAARANLVGARCNFIRCHWTTVLKATIEASRGAVSFWDSTTVLVRPLVVKDGGAFHFDSACTLNGIPATGPELCRAYNAVSLIDSDDDVDSSLFYSSPVGAA